MVHRPAQANHPQRQAEYRIANAIFRVAYVDITTMRTDAIVSSDDNYLSMGGGVSMAIASAAGRSLREEARKHIPLKLGDVAVTSAGALRAKYIFHAVTIDKDEMVFPNEAVVQAATARCLELAEALKLRTIAFPALGTGTGRFPFHMAAEVMTRTIADHLLGASTLDETTLVLWARRGVRSDDLAVFYERAVAIAANAAQVKNLESLLAELRNAARSYGEPALRDEIDRLQKRLAQIDVPNLVGATRVAESEVVQDPNDMELASEEALSVSGRTQATLDRWKDREVETTILRTKVAGLGAQLNIKMANLNKLEVEAAKYGGVDVPLRLQNAIEELARDVKGLEDRFEEARAKLTAIEPG